MNAADLQLIGKGFSDTRNSYERLPARLDGRTRSEVWSLSKNCSGLAIRFRTNSPIISAKWEVTGDVIFNHMAPTGIKGVRPLLPNEWKVAIRQFSPSGKKNNKQRLSSTTWLKKRWNTCCICRFTMAWQILKLV